MNRFRDIRAVDRVTLTRVRYCIGDGIEGDVVRLLNEWWDDDGNLVYAENDPFPSVEGAGRCVKCDHVRGSHVRVTDMSKAGNCLHPLGCKCDGYLGPEMAAPIGSAE